MKTRIRLTLLISLVLVSVVGVTGCAPIAAQPPATELPPTEPPIEPSSTPSSNAEIVLNMVERLNAGDVEGSMAYFADDAVAYLIGLPPTGTEVYAGKDQIRALWEDSVSNHFQWEVKILSSPGDEVYVQAKTWHDFTRELGVAPLEYSDVYEVRDGRITTYGSWLTEESLARFRPALAEVMPPEATAAPSSDPPVSEMTVTIAGGTCSTNSPTTLEAGEVTVTLDVQDRDKSLYALTLFSLDEGKDVLDLMVSTVGTPPSWVDMVLLQELQPGRTATYTFTVAEGPVYGVCWSKPPDMAIGALGPFMVVPAAPEPTPTPELVKAAITDLKYLVGTWERSDEGALQFNADGTYLVSETVAGIASGHASHGECWFDGSLLIFADQDGSGDGSYAVELRRTVGGDLVSIKFRAVDDPFVDRRETLASVWSWVAP
jgi:ketosteroid isomerase-like protein